MGDSSDGIDGKTKFLGYGTISDFPKYWSIITPEIKLELSDLAKVWDDEAIGQLTEKGLMDRISGEYAIRNLAIISLCGDISVNLSDDEEVHLDGYTSKYSITKKSGVYLFGFRGDISVPCLDHKLNIGIYLQEGNITADLVAATAYFATKNGRVEVNLYSPLAGRIVTGNGNLPIAENMKQKRGFYAPEFYKPRGRFYMAGNDVHLEFKWQVPAASQEPADGLWRDAPLQPAP